jgi:hypothetical protein
VEVDEKRGEPNDAVGGLRAVQTGQPPQLHQGGHAGGGAQAAQLHDSHHGRTEQDVQDPHHSRIQVICQTFFFWGGGGGQTGAKMALTAIEGVSQ